MECRFTAVHQPREDSQVNVQPSKRGKQLLPTPLFSTQHLSFLMVLHGEIGKAVSPKEKDAARNRYISHLTNSLRAATTPEAVRQLKALPCPNDKLERQLQNKLSQLQHGFVMPQSQAGRPFAVQFAS